MFKIHQRRGILYWTLTYPSPNFYNYYSYFLKIFLATVLKIAFSKIISHDQFAFYSNSSTESKLKHRWKKWEGKKKIEYSSFNFRNIAFILLLSYKASCNIKCLKGSPWKQWLKEILDYWSLLFFYHTSVVIVTLHCILQWNLWTKDWISFNIGSLGSADIYLWESSKSYSITAVREKKLPKS